MKTLIILSGLVAFSVASTQSRNYLLDNYLNSNQNLQTNIVGVNDAQNFDVNVNSRRGIHSNNLRTNQNLQSNVDGVNDAQNFDVNVNSRRGIHSNNLRTNQNLQSNIDGVNDAQNFDVNVNSRRGIHSNNRRTNQNRQSNLDGVNDAQNFDVNVNSRRGIYSNNLRTNLQLQSNFVNVNDADNVAVNRNARRGYNPYSLSNQVPQYHNDGTTTHRQLAKYYDNQNQNGFRSHDENLVLCMCPPSDPKICGNDGRTYYGVCQFNCGLNINPSLRIIDSIPCQLINDLRTTKEHNKPKRSGV